MLLVHKLDGFLPWLVNKILGIIIGWKSKWNAFFIVVASEYFKSRDLF